MMGPGKARFRSHVANPALGVGLRCGAGVRVAVGSRTAAPSICRSHSLLLRVARLVTHRGAGSAAPGVIEHNITTCDIDHSAARPSGKLRK